MLKTAVGNSSSPAAHAVVGPPDRRSIICGRDGLAGVSDYEVDLGHLPEDVGRALGVAPGDDDDAVWILSPGGAYRLSRLAVCDVGDRTAIQNVKIGRLSFRDDVVSRGGELLRQGLSVGLIELAAVRFEPDCRLCCW